jgi:WD40 repeat protein/tetratricopeptide (TPR) repeat protein
MDRSDSGFYVTGGSLRSDTPSYIERTADSELYTALQLGEFCYVLTSRQMGKSSLIHRTAARLRPVNVHVIVLDLTALGQNLGPEQWYFGLLERLGEQVGMEDALEQFWLSHERLGPLQRWIGAIREVVLIRCSGPVVIFIDEIDMVRSLPFSTDEFFAAIRECYNRRPQDSEFSRLTFCLMGVAAPTDLIRDMRMTPFNIGRRIELTDFTPEEAAPLAEGFLTDKDTQSQRQYREKGKAEHAADPILSSRQSKIQSPKSKIDEPASRELLARILYWTGGHPYLTQRLCRAVAECVHADPSPGNGQSAIDHRPSDRPTPALVDRVCADLFLSHCAQERDDNLIFVRERLLRSGADLTALLELYSRVWRGIKIPYNVTDPLIDLLRLTGVAGWDMRRRDRDKTACLHIRNRIYARVFDRQWIQGHMPDAELLRQRAAYLRGLLRAATASACLVVAMGVLAANAISKEAQANQALNLAAYHAKVAEQAQGKATRLAASLQTTNAQLKRALTEATAQRLRATGETRRALKAEGNERAQRLQAQYARARADLQRREAQRQQRIAEAKTQESHQRLVRFEVANGMRLVEANDLLGALPWLADALRLDRGEPQREQMHRIRVASVMRLCPRLTFVYSNGSGKDVAAQYSAAQLSPDGRYLAVGDTAGVIRVWDRERRSSVPLLLRHGGTILYVSFSPDGRQLVSAGSDGTARLWDTATGTAITPALRHNGIVFRAIFSSDGARIATASGDRTARIWDAATGRPLTPPLRHNGAVVGIAFSPDGTRVATANSDMTARIWETSTGNPVGAPLSHPSPVTAVAFNPNGRQIVTCCGDGTARLWDTMTARSLAAPLMHTGTVNYAAFSPDGRRIVTASEDATARVWDATTGQPLGAPLKHEEGVIFAAFSADGRRVVTTSRDQTARIWYAASGQPLGPPLQHGNTVCYAAFLQDGRVLTVSLDQTARLWCLASQPGITRWTVADDALPVMNAAFSPNGRYVLMNVGQVLIRDMQGEHAITPLWRSANTSYAAFSPDSRRVVTASTDGTARIWDASNGEPIVLPLRHNGSVIFAAFSPNGRRVVTTSSDGAARIWSAATGKPLTLPLRHNGSVTYAAFSPDGCRLVTASEDATARVWEVATGRQIMPPLRHAGSINRAAFSPDGRRIVTAGADGTCRVWDAITGKTTTPALVHGGSVVYLAFHPSGRRLVTASADGTARVWDTATGRPLTAPMRHCGDLLQAIYSPNGRLIAVTGADGTARIWDAGTGEPVTPPLRHTGVIRAIAFSPDGRCISTAGTDGTVRTWQIAPETRPVNTLLRTARLLSGSRISPDTGAEHLGSTMLREWQTARTGYPADFVWKPMPDRVWRQEEADYYASRACREMALAQRENALVDLSQAIDIEPDQTAYWLRRAEVEREMRLYERALADCAKVRELTPDNWQVWQFCGNIEASLRHWRECETESTRALTLRPESWNAWGTRGVARLYLGKWKEASADLTRAIARNPDEAISWINRARSYVQLGEPARAEADYDTAIRLRPSDPGAWREKALLQLLRGDLAGYRATCTDMLALFNTVVDPGIANHAAWICALAPDAVTDYTASLRLIEYAVAEQRTYNSLNTLGSLLYRAGRYAEAIQRIDEACAMSKGGRPEDWLILAMANRRLGHEQEARRWLDKAAPEVDKAVRQKPTHPQWISVLEQRILLNEAQTLLGRARQ